MASKQQLLLASKELSLLLSSWPFFSYVSLGTLTNTLLTVSTHDTSLANAGVVSDMMGQILLLIQGVYIKRGKRVPDVKPDPTPMVI